MTLSFLQIEVTALSTDDPNKLLKFFDDKTSKHKIKIYDKHIETTLYHTLPDTKYEYVSYHKITEYNYSKVIKEIFSNKCNTKISYQGNNEIKDLYLNLGWWDRQKLYLMMGDHIILKDGNFKWLVGGFLGFLLFLYSNKQSDIQAEKDEIIQEYILKRTGVPIQLIEQNKKLRERIKELENQ